MKSTHESQPPGSFSFTGSVMQYTTHTGECGSDTPSKENYKMQENSWGMQQRMHVYASLCVLFWRKKQLGMCLHRVHLSSQDQEDQKKLSKLLKRGIARIANQKKLSLHSPSV